MEVASFAGQTVTVGMIASFVAQVFKIQFLRDIPHRKAVMRIFVGIVCVLINAGVTYANGGVLDLAVLGQAGFSYLSAAATFDHLFS